MYFCSMLKRNKILSLLLIIGFFYSAVQLYLTPNAVAWMASALAHLVVLISIRMERIPEFDITVFYFDPSLPPRTHTIKNCRFKNNIRSVGQGDTSIPCELELVCSHVEFT